MSDDDALETGIDVHPQAEALARTGMDEAACLALATQATPDLLDDHGTADQDLADLRIVLEGVSHRLGDLAEAVIA